MKLDLEMAIPTPKSAKKDPFALGWRYTKAGAEDWRKPLTEEDLLFPAEGDFVVNNQAHNDDRMLLATILRDRAAGRLGLRVFSNHLINFGVKGLRTLGCDAIALTGKPKEWNQHRAVFPVKKMAARPMFVIERTSPTTRRQDLVNKRSLFYQAGVPIYVLVDLPYGGGKHPHGIVAFQAGPTDYEMLPPDRGGRVWLEAVEVDLDAEDGRLVCDDVRGNRIEDYSGQVRRIAEAQAEIERAKQQTAREKVLAEKAKAQAASWAMITAAQRARADDAIRRIAEIEAEIRRLRGDTN